MAEYFLDLKFLILINHKKEDKIGSSMKTIYATVFIILFASALNAQDFCVQKILTGNLSADAKLLLEDYEQADTPQLAFNLENRKTPILAGVLSLLVPGAGEIYTEEYLKAGIFIAIEAAVISTAVIYDGKGDDKTTEFQNYADDYKNPEHHWSVVKYAKWLVAYEGADENLLLPNGENPDLPPWEQVDWAELNAVETGSHHLPSHGEQQYYELIGKYHQYSSGWNDFPENEPNKDLISPNFLFYAGMRGDANDFYSVAKTAVIGIYVNHFLSALDAVWSAVSFNKDLAVKVRLENIQLTNRAEFIPTVYMTYNF